MDTAKVGAAAVPAVTMPPVFTSRAISVRATEGGETMPLIDDFTTGSCSITSINRSTPQQYQAGEMMGGGRSIYLDNAYNIRNQPAHLDVGTANRLNLTIGAREYVRLEVAYGFRPDGSPTDGVQAPLNADLHKLGTAFRTKVNAANGIYAINFNILVFTPNGYSQRGVNFVPSMEPFQVDLPFNEFAGPGGTDFSNVSFIVFIFQTWDDLAIDFFEIV